MTKAESNRLNALKSTGPKTPEGKAASSRNAVRHGAYSEAVTVLGEALEDFEGMRAGMVAAMAPEGALEERLVDRLASLWWRLERAGRVEREGLVAVLASKGQGEQGNTFRSMAAALYEDWMVRLMRYEGQLERSFFRTMHEMERIQARRQGEAVPTPAAVDVTIHGASE